ncbi:MAG: phosphoglucosamine mutase, partial [Lachnospiraceae bacterium]|nr:phosphoglucosamine mutase [Lachnospiraceae bacterium]
GKLTEPVTIFPKLLKNIRVKDKDIVLNDADVKKAVEDAEAMLGTEGRMLFRASGTEPLIRVMAEARSEELAANSVDLVINKIKELGYEE